MKLILKITVLDRILEEVAKARRNNREPDYLVVTPEEHDELRNDRRAHTYVARDWDYMCSPGDMVSATSKMVVRDFELGSDGKSYVGNRGRYLRCMSREKIMGYPLYVVPIEYHPA